MKKITLIILILAGLALTGCDCENSKTYLKFQKGDIVSTVLDDRKGMIMGTHGLDRDIYRVKFPINSISYKAEMGGLMVDGIGIASGSMGEETKLYKVEYMREFELKPFSN